MKALGNSNADDFNPKGAAARAASGRGMTFTKACGLGASMVANLDRVVDTAKRQYADDRKAAARERADEREANAFAALDELLSDI